MTTDLLTISLQAAVPLRVAEIRERGEEAWWQTVQARKAAWAQLIAEKGDILQYGGGKKGEVARIFNEVALAIAHLAFVPGGVRFNGSHFEEHFSKARTLRKAKRGGTGLRERALKRRKKKRRRR